MTSNFAITPVGKFTKDEGVYHRLGTYGFQIVVGGGVLERAYELRKEFCEYVQDSLKEYLESRGLPVIEAPVPQYVFAKNPSRQLTGLLEKIRMGKRGIKLLLSTGALLEIKKRNTPRYVTFQTKRIGNRLDSRLVQEAFKFWQDQVTIASPS